MQVEQEFRERGGVAVAYRRIWVHGNVMVLGWSFMSGVPSQLCVNDLHTLRPRRLLVSFLQQLSGLPKCLDSGQLAVAACAAF